MKKLVCNGFFLMALHSLVIAESLDTIHQKVEEYLEFMQVPGAALGIIKNGEIVFAETYGVRDLETKEPVTSRTLFPIGSSTKAFTAFLLGQFVDQGLFDWDDPVSEYIAHFRLKNAQTTYEITLRDYLNHLSGYATHDGIWYNEDMSRADLIYRLRYLEPSNSLRKAFAYQNIGYTVAAHVAESLTGRSWEELMAERVFMPLGMNDSNCTIKDLLNSSDYATGYFDYRGEIKKMPFLEVEPIGPGAAINSNLDDLLRWAGALIEEGQGLVSDKTWNELTKPQTISSIIRKDGYENTRELIMEAYAMGWVILPYKNQKIMLHGGHLNGFSSNVIIIPEEKSAVVILCNKHYSPLVYLLPCLILDQLLDVSPTDWLERYKVIYEQYQSRSFVYQDEVARIHRKQDTVTSHPLADYVGHYENSAYGSCEIRLEKGALVGRFHHMDFPLDHWHYDTFSIVEGGSNPILEGLKLTFHSNSYGEVASLSIPFELSAPPISFRKIKEESPSKKIDLMPFTGVYKYLGFSIYVTSDGEKLTVTAMGQPPFYLHAEQETLFSVEDYEGYLVQFITNEEDKVVAIQLIQPDGKVYTAKRSSSS